MMTCIHGLDENNCPTCRLIRTMLPLDPISKPERNKYDFRTKNSLFEENNSLKTNFNRDLKKKELSKHPLLQQIPELTKFGELPNNINYLFNERLRMLQFSDTSHKLKIDIDNHEIELD